jgi:DNA-binding transcriptional MerR regulator
VYKIGQLAELARVSVRTLHHYDDIGLVKPSARSEAGYRLYTQSDLERLQQVLFFRELGFALEQIARIVTDPAFDRRTALIEQRALLLEQAKKTEALVRLVDRTLASIEKGEAMKTEEMFEGFDPSKYETEAKERWGDTSAYQESKKRTKSYKKEDWVKIQAAADAIHQELARLMEAGVAPSDPRAMDVADQHRRHIDRWFYACSRAMHVGLGEMYLADERFTAHYERVRPGLTQYLVDAIRANAERAERA